MNHTPTQILLVLGLLAGFALGCGNKAPVSETVPTPTPEPTSAVPAIEVAGDYASDGYAQRAEGSDWVAVTVAHIQGDSISISVRSRADKKKPTCTFDAGARKENDSTYKTLADGKTIVFSFGTDNLNISTEKTEDAGLLNYYCSGGGSLAGNYKKLTEALDQTQIDKPKGKK